MKRQISTRVSDFKQLIEEGSLYVDKTKYVYEMVKQKGNDYFFISRPRRYGKSLFCSTLEHLFKGERELFKGLYIAEETDYGALQRPLHSGGDRLLLREASRTPFQLLPSEYFIIRVLPLRF